MSIVDYTLLIPLNMINTIDDDDDDDDDDYDDNYFYCVKNDHDQDDNDDNHHYIEGGCNISATPRCDRASRNAFAVGLIAPSTPSTPSTPLLVTVLLIPGRDTLT